MKVKRKQKNIDVVDTEGNKRILKATVISMPKNKSQSQEITDEKVQTLASSGEIILPPLPMWQLAILRENSSELGQTLDAMTIGVEGFGGRLVLKDIPESLKKTFKEKIEEERNWLQTNLVDFPNPDGNLTKLRQEKRTDLESTGNAYLELIRSPLHPERFTCYNRLDPATMFITKLDDEPTRMNIKFTDENFTLKTKSFFKKFRRFVNVVGNKKTYFKEFSDPRIIDKRTGRVADETLLPQFRANEVKHFSIYNTRRTPYGLPRYTGNIIAIKGSRNAEESNILTQQNNNVPSMVFMVSGGQLTEGSVRRIEEFVDSSVQSDKNYSKFLILEGESQHDTLSGTDNVKIDVRPLTNNQISDQIWQEYDKNNASKIRRSFRMMPLLTGEVDNLNRSVAQESERLAEKYVFNPEREMIDETLNKLITQQGFKFWVYKSNSPNVTNDQDLVRILTGAEKTGGLTPRISRMLLEDILNKKLPEFPDNFDPDVPFSFTLAQLMHSAGKANQNGTMESQGQTPKTPESSEVQENIDTDKVSDSLDPHFLLDKMLETPDKFVNAFKKVSDLLEQDLNKELPEDVDDKSD